MDAVCGLAWALYLTYGYGPALQVLESLSAAARQTVEARVGLGSLHRFAGNFALAAKAYGDPRDLDRDDRRDRRRCARRALAQRLRSSSRDDVDALDLAASRTVGSLSPTPGRDHLLSRYPQPG